MTKVLTILLTNDIVSFEQLGPGVKKSKHGHKSCLPSK